VFDGSLDQYAAIAFYTIGDLTKRAADGSPSMTARGKQRLISAIADGKGFVGFHSATDTFHSKSPQNEDESQVGPYLAMIGAESVAHGEQQEASLLFAPPKFPGIGGVGVGEGLAFTDEWYTFKNFASGLHVILVQETRMMKGKVYRRPDFPATWAHTYGNGRVFYTSLGHREDIWTNPFFQAMVIGAVAWVSGRVQADVAPNMEMVTPQARRLRNV